MNQNIKIVTPNLWVVNFHFVQMGYIQDINFQATNADDSMCLLTDGRWLVNSSFPQYEQFLPYIKEVMRLPSDKLKTSHGFLRVIKGMCPGLKGISGAQIELIIEQHHLEPLKTIFENLCGAEIKRRQLQKDYKKNSGKIFGVRLLFKNIQGKAGDG